MSETFGQAFRQDTQEVQGGAIAPASTDVTGRSVAQASAKGTVDSNFTQNDTPERKQIDTDALQIANALMSVAGAVGDVVVKEQKRKQAIEGARMAGTEEGRQAIDAMGEGVFNKMFGPGATQRAGQQQIVKDSTIALNGKLTNDAGTIGLKMSEGEWNAHVDKTIASQTDRYEDEEIKDMITGDFSKRMGTIQSSWIKQSTIYQQEANKQAYQKTVASTLTQVDADLDSPDPQIQADARAAVKDILANPGGMAEGAHKDSIVAALSSQLHQGRKGVFDAVKATGVFSTLDQEDQNQLQTLESEYNEKNSIEWATAMNDLDLSIDAVDLDGNARFTTSELLAKEERLKALDPIAYAAMGREPMIARIMANGEKQNNIRKKKAHNVSLYTTDEFAFGLLTPKEQAEAMETHMDDLAVKSMGEDLDAAVSSSGLPRETAPITANEITSWQRDNVRLWSNDWKKGQTVSPKVKAMGQDTLFKLETITADNPGDESLRTELSNLMVLRQTDPELFTDTFGATDAAKMETLYNAINKSGGKPWAAVARYNQEAERTHQNGGVRMEASPEKVESDMEKFKEDFLEEVDLSGTDGFLWFDKTEPENWFEIQSIARDYYEEAYARQGDGTQAIAEAKARLLKGGTLVGNNFIPGGQAMVDGTVNGVKVNQWLQGISDDSDTRAAVIETYGLDSNVDLVNDLRFARTSPDGAILYGTIENAQGIGMPVQFGRPTREEQVLQTDASKRTEMVKNVLRTSRDAVQEVYNVGAANNGKQPLQNAGESVIGGFTKLVTGRSANATPEQIEANAAHVAATQKLKDFDAEQHLKDNTYVGEAAIKQVEELEGRTLSYMERIVVKDEGFVANGVEYQDKKGMATGVGQTGEYMGLSFDESFKAHVNKARGMTAGFDKYPEYLRAQIVSATYRGSWGLSGKTRKLLAAGKPMEAAVEFLDNDEFRAKTTPDGVKARMQRVADALTAYAQQSN